MSLLYNMENYFQPKSSYSIEETDNQPCQTEAFSGTNFEYVLEPMDNVIPNLESHRKLLELYFQINNKMRNEKLDQK
jgi:hypothetical protein